MHGVRDWDSGFYTHAEARRRELEALYRADEYLYRHLRLEQVLQTLVDVVVDILRVDKASMPAWERLEARAAGGYSVEMVALMFTYRPGDGIAGNVFLTDEPISIEDARHAPLSAEIWLLLRRIRDVSPSSRRIVLVKHVRQRDEMALPAAEASVVNGTSPARAGRYCGALVG